MKSHFPITPLALTVLLDAAAERITEQAEQAYLKNLQHLRKRLTRRRWFGLVGPFWNGNLGDAIPDDVRLAWNDKHRHDQYSDLETFKEVHLSRFIKRIDEFREAIKLLPYQDDFFLSMEDFEYLREAKFRYW